MSDESWLRGARGLAFASLLAASGCSSAGTSPTADPPGATFSAVYPMLFPADTAPKCNFCHSMPASDISNGLLHLGTDKETAYVALVGKAALGSKCKDRPLVVAGQPDMSLLVQKFAANPPCGEQMPQGGAPLTDAQVEQVRSWIAAGAKDD